MESLRTKRQWVERGMCLQQKRALRNSLDGMFALGTEVARCPCDSLVERYMSHSHSILK